MAESKQNNGTFVRIGVWTLIVAAFGILAYGINVNHEWNTGQAAAIAEINKEKLDKADFCRFETRMYDEFKEVNRKMDRLLSRTER